MVWWRAAIRLVLVAAVAWLLQLLMVEWGILRTIH